MHDPHPELVAVELSKTYPNGVRALDGVSLAIPRGMFGLLGPNGAGKTTLIRIMATLQQPDSGTLSFGGLDVIRRPEYARKMLGYLPQEFGFDPRARAAPLLEHFAALRGIPRSAGRRGLVESLLDRVNLSDSVQRRMGDFSGGMRQRFGIAVALLGNPRLLIVDEPTAGLDPAERNRFHNLLSEVGEEVVVVLSTHIVEDVADLCGSMAIIDRGRILFSGDPSSARETLRGKVWQKSIAKADVPEYEARFRVLSTRLFAGRTVVHVFEPRCPDPSFEPIDPSLEDAYFHTLLHHGPEHEEASDVA